MRGLVIATTLAFGLIIPAGLSADTSLPRLKCLDHYSTIRGSANPDVIIGTDRTNVIRADRGGDVVFAGDGRDYVCGNRGNDNLVGGDGYDSINGGPGIDACTGEIVINCEGGGGYGRGR